MAAQILGTWLTGLEDALNNQCGWFGEFHRWCMTDMAYRDPHSGIDSIAAVQHMNVAVQRIEGDISDGTIPVEIVHKVRTFLAEHTPKQI